MIKRYDLYGKCGGSAKRDNSRINNLLVFCSRVECTWYDQSTLVSGNGGTSLCVCVCDTPSSSFHPTVVCHYILALRTVFVLMLQVVRAILSPSSYDSHLSIRFHLSHSSTWF